MKLFAHAAQQIESKGTSLNQVAATFAKVEFRAGETNLDYGGGRYDKAAQFLEARGVRNVVYDPYNRGLAHNLSARLTIARLGGAHTVTVNNVLNVIAEPQALAEAIEQAAQGLRADGTAYFLIHEGDRSGKGRATTKGWQRNEKAECYLEAVKRRFGAVVRKGNLIAATHPVKLAHGSLFELASVHTQTRAWAKTLGVPQPSVQHGVGKAIGGCLYVHRSAWDALPALPLAAAQAHLPPRFNPTIAKWEPATGCFSFVESKGFDSEAEPAIQDAIKVFPDGTTTTTRERSDPQIYHHKWNFVRPTYEGFDYFDSMIRSIAWAKAPCDRARIGTRSVWESEVVWPHLGGVGAVEPQPPLPAAPSRRSRSAP